MLLIHNYLNLGHARRLIDEFLGRMDYTLIQEIYKDVESIQILHAMNEHHCKLNDLSSKYNSTRIQYNVSNMQ